MVAVVIATYNSHFPSSQGRKALRNHFLEEIREPVSLLQLKQNFVEEFGGGPQNKCFFRVFSGGFHV